MEGGRIATIVMKYDSCCFSKLVHSCQMLTIVSVKEV